MISSTLSLAESKLLGRIEAPKDGMNKFPVDVYFFRFSSDSEPYLATKLFLPVGQVPRNGWTTSIWCHGLGDPATQYRRWPFTNQPWQATRGMLAGGWAQYGIATLCPWLPGDGPSEPYGTYSPFSLERNSRALDRCIALLRKLAADATDDSTETGQEHARASMNFNLDRLIMRFDCVAAPLVVHFVSPRFSSLNRNQIAAIVADNFQPSIAYNEGYLGKLLNRAPAVNAAAIRCIWLRTIWSLSIENDWPLDHFFSDAAISLFSETVEVSFGLVPRLLGVRLVPHGQTELAALVMNEVAKMSPNPTGDQVRRWLYSSPLNEWAELPTIKAMVRSDFYQKYFAASDPFFEETIEPFTPGIPLLVSTSDDVDRAENRIANPNTVPSGRRFDNMARPKLERLRNWGWDIHIHQSQHSSDTTFAEGPAQAWAMERLRPIIDG